MESNKVIFPCMYVCIYTYILTFNILPIPCQRAFCDSSAFLPKLR